MAEAEAVVEMLNEDVITEEGSGGLNMDPSSPGSESLSSSDGEGEGEEEEDEDENDGSPPLSPQDGLAAVNVLAGGGTGLLDDAATSSTGKGKKGKQQPQTVNGAPRRSATEWFKMVGHLVRCHCGGHMVQGHSLCHNGQPRFKCCNGHVTAARNADWGDSPRPKGILDRWERAKPLLGNSQDAGEAPSPIKPSAPKQEKPKAVPKTPPKPRAKKLSRSQAIPASAVTAVAPGANIAVFYDNLAPYYRYFYPDWSLSVERQALNLDAIVMHCYGGSSSHPAIARDHVKILDAACGIGTQALGLAGLGYDVTATDISFSVIEEAKQEARRRGLYYDDELIGKSRIKFPGLSDLRSVGNDLSPEGFDIVIACDNVIPHLPSPADISEAFRQVRDCLLRRTIDDKSENNGLFVLSVRDYATIERPWPSGSKHYPRIVHTYEVEPSHDDYSSGASSHTTSLSEEDPDDENGDVIHLVEERPAKKARVSREHYKKRVILFDIWDFESNYYDLSTYVVEELSLLPSASSSSNSTSDSSSVSTSSSTGTTTTTTTVIRGGRYYWITIEQIEELLKQAGFEYIRVFKNTNRFFQPLIVACVAQNSKTALALAALPDDQPTQEH